MGANEGLERAYREIGRAGVGALELRDWPRSSYFLEHCETRPEDGALLPRRFETDPVVGVSCELGEDREHVQLLETAQRVFSDILQEARERCLTAAASREFATRGIWWAPRESFHAVVSIFSEHPDLLDRDARRRWTPVPEDKLEHELGVELRSDLWAYPVPPINLRLHGYRFCADGALIACFVDADADGGNGEPGGAEKKKEENAPEEVDAADAVDARVAFGALRRRVKALGVKTLGALSSRPKRIIHVTLGRVLRLPDALMDDAQREALLAHLRRVAAKLHANETVDFSADARAEPGGWRIAVEGAPPRERIVAPGLGGVLRVREASLTVEKRWWMTEYEVLAKIPLAKY